MLYFNYGNSLADEQILINASNWFDQASQPFDSMQDLYRRPLPLDLSDALKITPTLTLEITPRTPDYP